MNQVTPPHGDLRVIAFDLDAGPGASQGHFEPVVERYRLDYRANFVVAVRAFAQDLQAEIDLGESAESDRVFQSK